MAYKPQVLAIANGGTDSTSFTASNGILTYNGTSLVNYTAPTISSAGIVQNSAQPAFNVYVSTSPTDITGDGTEYIVAWDTKVFDQGNNFSTSTHIFTAPVTGLYQFNFSVGVNQLSSSHTDGIGQLIIAGTSAQTYSTAILNYYAAAAINTVFLVSGSWLVPMTAGDTAKTAIYVFNGAKTVELYGEEGNCSFSGFLVC